MNPLELKDIHLPDSSLWWPPAPGWWLLLLILIALLLLTPWLLKRLRRKSLKALSLREIARIREAAREGSEDRLLLRELSALIRRILISYYGREQVAAASGSEWQARIEQLAPGASFSEAQLRLLGEDRYRREVEADIEALLQSSECWVRALPQRYIDVRA